MSRTGRQWSIHRGSILIKASTRSKYHRRGNIPPTIPYIFNLVSHARLSLACTSKYFPFFRTLSTFPLKQKKKEKRSRQILSNETPSLEFQKKTSHRFISPDIYLKPRTDFHPNQPLVEKAPPNRHPKLQNGSDRWFHSRNPSRVDRRYGLEGGRCFMGRANCTRLRRRGRGGNVALGEGDEVGYRRRPRLRTIPYRAATLSAGIHSLSLYISPPLFLLSLVPIFSPFDLALRRDAAREIRV